MDNSMNVNDFLSFKDSHGEKHGLRGHVTIYREDPETKKLSLWDEDDNIIPISGYQWILMKMFDLYLDSKHGDPYEDLTRDTTIEIPDLNYQDQLNIGTNPSSYESITSNIPENHFVQGFMVGNGGGGEDNINAKNTDYSFTKLRNPIPFQQTDSFNSTIANKYLGVYRMNNGSSVKSYYIKRFDETPHIVHSWWKTDQEWDYIDPVTQSDLGPDSQITPKTNRIETYVTCSLSISDTDCQSFFTNEGNNQSPVINELGLVAFDAVLGEHTIIQTLYNQKIKRYLNLAFAHQNEADYTQDEKSEFISLNNEIYTVFQPFVQQYTQSNMQAFCNVLLMVRAMVSGQALDFGEIKEQLSLQTNIGVVAYYNQSGTFMYEEDEFMTYLDSIEFTDFDEAQRIKLITYYTFKSIPIQSNVRWVIDYRLYSN